MSDQQLNPSASELAGTNPEAKKTTPTPEEYLKTQLESLKSNGILTPRLENNIVGAISEATKVRVYDLGTPTVDRVKLALLKVPGIATDDTNPDSMKLGIKIATDKAIGDRRPSDDFIVESFHTGDSVVVELKGKKADETAKTAAVATLLAENAPVAALRVMTESFPEEPRPIDRFIPAIKATHDTSPEKSRIHLDAVLAGLGNEQVTSITKIDLTGSKEISTDLKVLQEEAKSRLKQRSNERARGQIEVELRHGQSDRFVDEKEIRDVKTEIGNWITSNSDRPPLGDKIYQRSLEIARTQLINDAQREVFLACFPEDELASIYELSEMSSAVTRENLVTEPGKSDFCGQGGFRSPELTVKIGDPRLESLLTDPNKIRLRDIETIINSGKYGADVLEKLYPKYPEATIKIMQRAILAAEVFSALYGQPKINSDLQADFVGSGAVNEFKATYQNFNPDFQARAREAKIESSDGTSKTFGEIMERHIKEMSEKAKQIADSKEKNLAVAQEKLRKSALESLSERLDYNTALPTMLEAKILARTTVENDLRDARNNLQMNQDTFAHLQNQIPKSLNPLTWGNPSSEQIASEQKRISEAIVRRKAMIQKLEADFTEADKAVKSLGTVSSIKNNAERSKKASDYLKTGVWKPDR